MNVNPILFIFLSMLSGIGALAVGIIMLWVQGSIILG